jgi:two-component system, OmpR family, sensor histidine kinase PhoQ
MGTRSLSTRLLASVGVVLVLFLGITIVALDMVYRNLSEGFMRTRLDLQVANLIAASDEHLGGKLLPGETLREPRYEHVGSGLYGQIQRDDGEVLWWSHSLTDTKLELFTIVPPGKPLTRRMKLPDGSEVQALSVNLEWEFPRRKLHRFIYTVAEDLAPHRAELLLIRKELFIWFGGLLVLLLVALAVLFRWVMQPVRRVEREIAEIERGGRKEFSKGYPRELAGITTNMNVLLRNDQDRLERYRNTLGNLAHSLKTPLAVLRSLATTPQLQDQVTSMDKIVSYQLKRAAMSGATGFGQAPIEIGSTIKALKDTLTKVYLDKRVSIDLQIDSAARFVGDEGDLMEVAGNLLDNACKWCRTKVVFTAKPVRTINSRRDGLMLVVEDDGPGIAPEKRAVVLKRGARLDEQVSGQGIGLSVVLELAQLSGGDVTIDESSLGGARFTVRLLAL